MPPVMIRRSRPSSIRWSSEPAPLQTGKPDPGPLLLASERNLDRTRAILSAYRIRDVARADFGGELDHVGHAAPRHLHQGLDVLAALPGLRGRVAGRELVVLDDRAVVLAFTQEAVKPAGGLASTLEGFLREQADNLHLKTLSVMEGRVSVQYQFRKRADFDRSGFVRRLNELAGPTRMEIFLGGA